MPRCTSGLSDRDGLGSNVIKIESVERTLRIWRRRVAPRATASLPPWTVPAARSRLWVIAAQIAQALLAEKRPEGMCASGPSIRSTNTVSMIACLRWVMSAQATPPHKALPRPARRNEDPHPGCSTASGSPCGHAGVIVHGVGIRVPRYR